MAKSTKEVKEKAIEVTLWEAANKLRGSVEPAEYKHVVLGLIFLKFASDKFEDHRAKLMAEGKEKYIEMPDFYNMNNVFFLEEISRWSYLIKKSKQNDIALLIDTALHTIEKNGTDENALLSTSRKKGFCKNPFHPNFCRKLQSNWGKAFQVVCHYLNLCIKCKHQNRLFDFLG